MFNKVVIRVYINLGQVLIVAYLFNYVRFTFCYVLLYKFLRVSTIFLLSPSGSICKYKINYELVSHIYNLICNVKSNSFSYYEK